MTFDYKNYSLEKLQEWIHDASNSGNASPIEIYDAIHSVITEQIEYHTTNLTNLTKLRHLLNGKEQSKNNVDIAEKYQQGLNDIWKDFEFYENSSSQYTDEELNAMCDAAESQQEKELCKEYNQRELEYCEPVNNRMQKVASMNYKEATELGWTMTDDGFWIPPQKEDKVNKWVLPVELSEEDYLLSLPTDLLNTVGWKEGDQLEWVSQNDNSYVLKKVTHEKQ